MRECFSLRLSFLKDPQTKQLRLVYYIKIMFRKYYDGTPIWKMIIRDTWQDIIN
jgi:hypothetical protein